MKRDVAYVINFVLCNLQFMMYDKIKTFSGRKKNNRKLFVTVFKTNLKLVHGNK